MAGLTTASLVSLYEPETRFSLAKVLGLPDGLPNLALISLLSTAFFSISFLAFLNIGQTFVLTSLLNVPLTEVGQITGTLVSVDEGLSLFLVLLYGAIIDRFGVRGVAAWGHTMVGIALIGYVNAKNVFYQLILMRLLYALGAAALVTSLTAGVSILSSFHSISTSAPAVPLAPSPAFEYASSQAGPSDERTRLLQATQTAEDDAVDAKDAAKDRADEEQRKNNNFGARVAGLIGFTAGCGALLAVFGYIRLPPLIATLFPSSFHLNSIIDTISSFSPITDEAGRSLVRGLRWTFYIIATIAFCEGTFLYFAFHLPSSLSPVLATNSLDSSADAIVEVKEKISIGVRMKEAVVDLGLGFKIASQEQEAALAYVATFTTRSASLVTSAFIPLLINNYFLENNLCVVPSAAGPSTCRPAFILSSTLTGIVQLTSLLLSPLLGSFSSRFSSPFILLVTLSLSSLSFAIFSLLPGGDPRNPIGMLTSIGMGIGQAGGLVSSLGLVSRVRERIVKREGREVGGAVSGAYSFCGGIGILIVGKLSGGLFDSVSPSAPFAIIATSHALVALFATYVCISHNRLRKAEKKERSTHHHHHQA